MLLMPSTDINFQALAENVSRQFFIDGVPLEDGIVKIAKENSLNPEEVIRLVEKSNTAASLYLLKTAEDKKASFTLAQVDLVLQRTHPTQSDESTAETEKTDSVYTGLPLRTKKLHPFFTQAGQVKTAAQKKVNYMPNIHVLGKNIEARQQEKLAAEKQARANLNYLSREFSKVNAPDLGKFASDCLSLYGQACKPVLQSIAKYMGLKKVPLVKQASYIDDTTDNMRAMQTVCQNLQKVAQLDAQIQEMQTAKQWYWQKARQEAVC